MKKLIISLLILLSTNLYAQVTTTTVVFKPGPTIGEDAYLWSLDDACVPTGFTSTPSTLNFGTLNELNATRWTWTSAGCGWGTTRSVIRFSEINSLPPGITIVNAELILRTPNPSDQFGNSVYPGSPHEPTNVAELIRINPGLANNWNESTITWNSHLSLSLSTSETILLPNTTSRWGYTVSLNLTSIVTNIYNDIQLGIPYANNGFLLRIIGEENNDRRQQDFASSDHTDETLWPELRITYKYGCDPSFNYCFNSSNPYVVNLSSVASTYISYEWRIDGILVGTSSSLTHTFPGPGYYKVCHKVIDENQKSCSDCVMLCIQEILEDDIREKPSLNSSIPDINILPNPTNESWHLVFQTETSEPIEITLFDISGRIYQTLQFNTNIGENKFKISSDNLSNGIYYLRVHNSKFNKTIKLIKKP